MTTKLDIIEERDSRYAIAWIVYEEEFGEDIGSYLGDMWDTVKDLKEAPVEREMNEIWLAEHTAYRFNPNIDSYFYWNTRAQALDVLRAVRFALKNIDRPLPEWAKEALSHGWKAPRGWKP